MSPRNCCRQSFVPNPPRLLSKIISLVPYSDLYYHILCFLRGKFPWYSLSLRCFHYVLSTSLPVLRFISLSKVLFPYHLVRVVPSRQAFLVVSPVPTGATLVQILLLRRLRSIIPKSLVPSIAFTSRTCTHCKSFYNDTSFLVSHSSISLKNNYTICQLMSGHFYSFFGDSPVNFYILSFLLVSLWGLFRHPLPCVLSFLWSFLHRRSSDTFFPLLWSPSITDIQTLDPSVV